MASQVLEGSVSPTGGPSVPFADVSPLWRMMNERDEPRQCVRRSLRCGMLLIDPGSRDGRDMIPGECLNISDGGLYGTVPLGYGVSLGQRYTLRLMVGERGPEPGAVQIVEQQGVIVRTELLVARDGSGDRLGIAIRLSGHRCGLIAMPNQW